METLLSMDRELNKILPDCYRSGAHLSFMYAMGHSKPLNEMNAFRYLQIHPEPELSSKTILKLYEAMTEGTPMEGKGFKETNNFFTSANHIYIPLPAEETPEAIDELCRKYAFLNHPRAEDFDSIFKFLLDFICIHPMTNGNGRLSVILVQMLMRNAGFKAALYIPFDMFLGRRYVAAYQKHILLASGSYYGQKPIEYELFVPFAKDLVKQSYEVMISSCKAFEPISER